MLPYTKLERAPVGAPPEGQPASVPCACGVALNVGVGPCQVYNEEAFRYFLAKEGERSASSNRPSLLLLLDLDHTAVSVNGALGLTFFSRLALCLRETDIMGWYREGRVAGAILTQLSDATMSDLPAHIQARVNALVRQALSADLASRLRMRLFRIPSPPPSRAEHEA